MNAMIHFVNGLLCQWNLCCCTQEACWWKQV